MSKKTTPNLTVCIIMDLIGCLSYAAPGIGEVMDIVWAPISGLIFYRMFGRGAFGAFGGAFNFMEELFPGTDFIPSFTIAWAVQRIAVGRKVEKKFAAVAQ